MPALLKSMSKRPQTSLVRANSARTEAGSLTSVGTGSSALSACWARRVVSSRGAARRPARITAYPAACRASAAARPMPLPAPVTSAILPLLLIAVVSSLDPARPKGIAPSGYQVRRTHHSPLWRRELAPAAKRHGHHRAAARVILNEFHHARRDVLGLEDL